MLGEHVLQRRVYASVRDSVFSAMKVGHGVTPQRSEKPAPFIHETTAVERAPGAQWSNRKYRERARKDPVDPALQREQLHTP